MKNKFIIVTPVYNSVKYIEKCLLSLVTQGYDNFEIAVMDDCSTDGTWDMINKMNNIHYRLINICRNESRMGSPLANIVKAIELFVLNDEDIICIVDGDDALTRSDVLSELNEVYQDTGVYMTYGQFKPQSGNYGEYCLPIPNPRTHRKERDWKASHLKTFKKKLWNKIKDEDLRDDDGQYYKFAGDCALLYPMIELCGHKHMRFISKVNYSYNDLNPLNEMSIQVDKQLSIASKIQDKPIYDELP